MTPTIPAMRPPRGAEDGGMRQWLLAYAAPAHRLVVVVVSIDDTHELLLSVRGPDVVGAARTTGQN